MPSPEYYVFTNFLMILAQQINHANSSIPRCHLPYTENALWCMAYLLYTLSIADLSDNINVAHIRIFINGTCKYSYMPLIYAMPFPRQPWSISWQYWYPSFLLDIAGRPLISKSTAPATAPPLLTFSIRGNGTMPGWKTCSRVLSYRSSIRKPGGPWSLCSALWTTPSL